MPAGAGTRRALACCATQARQQWRHDRSSLAGGSVESVCNAIHTQVLDGIQARVNDPHLRPGSLPDPHNPHPLFPRPRPHLHPRPCCCVLSPHFLKSHVYLPRISGSLSLPLAPLPQGLPSPATLILVLPHTSTPIAASPQIFKGGTDIAFKEAFYTHTSTSPNYQILASLDVGRSQMQLEVSCPCPCARE